MNVQERNDALIYSLSSGPTLPEWLGERARRNLSKRDDAIRRRIELLQDFGMPCSSSKIVQSRDGRYFVAAGTYPPRIRCYDVHELTMKFERYVNAEVVDMCLLSEDFGKMAILMDDRTIAFHAPYGAHESIRIPTFGRAMAYEPTTCELLLAAKGNQLFRLNLEEGRFCEPWKYEPSAASLTCISVSQSNPLAAVGCDDGYVRFWDNRSSNSQLRPFLKLDVKSATEGYGYYDVDTVHGYKPEEISSISHHQSGLYMAVGTAGGTVALYDVRSSRPLHVAEHKLGLPIHTVQFHSSSGTILSADEKLVKIWRYKPSSSSLSLTDSVGGGTGVGFVLANVEGSGKFTHFLTAGDDKDPNGQSSGLLMCATEQPKMEAFYIPALGPAPRWCSFLDSITEELEERDLTRDGDAHDGLVQSGQENIYENYKFVSREEVESLGISNLVGTPLLRGYMHGFFMDVKLYNRVRAVANPFEYEDYRKKKLKERIESKQASRIAPKKQNKKKAPSVNPELAARLSDKAGDKTKAGKIAKTFLSDDRFKDLFSNPDYQIDETNEDFKLRNPSGVAAAKMKAKENEDFDSDEEDYDDSVGDEQPDVVGFTQVESDVDDSESDGWGERDSDDDDDDSVEGGFGGAKVRGELHEDVPKKSKKHGRDQKKTKKRTKKNTMYEAEDFDDAGNAIGIGLGDSDAVNKAKRRKQQVSMSLGERLKMKHLEDAASGKTSKLFIKGEGTSREATFIPKASRKKQLLQEETDASGRRGRNRRGIQELKLRTPFKGHSK